LLQAAKGLMAELKSEPDVCPTCGKAWTKVHGQAEIEAQEKKVQYAASYHDQAKIKYDAQAAVVKDLNDKLTDIDGRLSKLKVDAAVASLSQEAESLSAEDAELGEQAIDLERQKAEHAAGPSKAEVNRAEAVVTERRRVLAEAEKEIGQASKALAESKEALKVARYWAKAFGPTGIPNMILQDSIAPLNDVSRRISNVMTGCTITVSYDTRRELASGLDTSELVINVDNQAGSDVLEGNSKGEAGVANLIIAETLSEVGSMSSRVGFRWYDEILNAKDELARPTILAYLKELAWRTGLLIFVVDHSPEVPSYTDHTLLVEKAPDGTTTARWMS
jgi:DNA repair exonuclease SbcCD ATPase subunit